MRINPVDPTSKLYKQNERLVYRCIKGLQVPVLCEFEDLEQVGKLGLLEAIKRYNSQKGFKFSTYAWYYIRGALLRFIRQNRCLVHIPVNFDNTFIDDIVVSSIDAKELHERIEYEVLSEDDIDTKIDNYLLRRILDKYMQELSPRRREAIERYYLTESEDGKKMSYDIVAKAMGISRERVRQLIDNGKRYIKKQTRHLDVYI